MEKDDFYRAYIDNILSQTGQQEYLYDRFRSDCERKGIWDGVIKHTLDRIYDGLSIDGRFDSERFAAMQQDDVPLIREMWHAFQNNDTHFRPNSLTSKELIVSLGVAGAVMVAVIGTGYWTYKRHKKATQTQTWEQYIKADASAKSELER